MRCKIRVSPPWSGDEGDQRIAWLPLSPSEQHVAPLFQRHLNLSNFCSFLITSVIIWGTSLSFHCQWHINFSEGIYSLLVFSSDNICGDHPIIWAIWCNLHNHRLPGVTRATGVKLFRQFILIRWNMWQMARDLLTIFVYKSWYKRLEFFKSMVCVAYKLYGRVIYGRALYGGILYCGVCLVGYFSLEFYGLGFILVGYCMAELHLAGLKPRLHSSVSLPPP